MLSTDGMSLVTAWHNLLRDEQEERKPGRYKSLSHRVQSRPRITPLDTPLVTQDLMVNTRDWLGEVHDGLDISFSAQRNRKKYGPEM